MPTAPERRTAPQRAGSSTADWSPTSRRLAFSSQRTGTDHIFVMRASGKHVQQLTPNGAATDSEPSFSPDGTDLAFQTDRDGNFEIYRMNDDGSEPVNLSNSPAGDFTPAWQPTERRY